MTDTALPPSPTDRIATLEANIRHIRELMDERDRMTSMRMAELIAQNRVQDQELEKLADAFGKAISKLTDMVWSFLKWLGGGLLGLLAAIILKKLGLV